MPTTQHPIDLKLSADAAGLIDAEVRRRLSEALATVRARVDAAELGFYELARNASAVEAVDAFTASAPSADDVILVGIGG